MQVLATEITTILVLPTFGIINFYHMERYNFKVPTYLPHCYF